MKADLHIHSNNSDGSDSIDALIHNIQQAGIDIFALTDHDTVDGLYQIEPMIPKSIRFIKGIELTCKTEDVKCHILGYNINPDNQILTDLIAKGKILRKKKLELRIDYLKKVWDIELTKDELNWLYSRKSVVKTHIANILVKRKLAKDNLSAMRKYLDDCKTGNSRFDGVEAIKAIKFAGGIPVWAHPLGGEGEIHSTPDDFLKKLGVMLKNGIQGLECYYSRYSDEEINFLVEIANKYNLYITGGSDYHGTNKDIPLAKLNVSNKPIDSEFLTIIKQIFS